MAQYETRNHSLRRTSPKGGPFIGVCVLCGQEMTLAEMSKTECPNQRRLTNDEAVIEAVRDRRDS